MEIRCKKCNQKIGEFTHVEGTIRCPKCKEDISLRIVDAKTLTQSFYGGTNKLEREKP